MAWYNEKFECPNPPDCAANQMVPPSEWNAMVAYLKDKIRGMPFTAPGAGDDGKYIKYVHGTPGFILETPAGGGTTWLTLTDTPGSFSGQAGKYPKVNAGETALEFSIPAGAGDVVGPASSVNNRIVLFDGVTGKLIKDAGKLLANTANNIPILDGSALLPLAQIPATLTGKDADSVDGCDAGIATGNVLKIPAGIAHGDIFYVDVSGHIVRLAAGTNGHFLKTQGAAANPIWAAGAGGVTTWLALTDTPGAFDNGKIVKSGAAALSFGMLESDIFKKDGSVAATGDFLPDTTGIRKLGSTLKHWGDIHSDNHYIHNLLYGGFKVAQDLLPNVTETHLLGSATYKWDIIWARTVDFNSVCTDLINRMSAGDYINFTDGIEFNGAAGRSIINITHLLPKTTGASDLGSSTLKFRKVYVGDIIAWDGLSGGIKCEQDWLPFTTNTYDIGSVSYYWENLFLNGYIDLLGSLYVDTIAERTAGVGVTIDNCLIKDGKAADTLKVKGKTVDDAAIGDDKCLTYVAASGKLEYKARAGGGSTTWLGLTDTPAAFTGQAGKYPKVNAGETALEFGTPSGGGDVVGPASSVNERIVLFDGVTGKLIKDAGKNIADLLEVAAGDFNAFAEKVSPANADIVLIEDSAASYAKKKVQVGNLPGGGGSSTWLGLTDTPGAFDNGKIVKSGAAALSFGMLESDIFKKDGSVAMTGNLDMGSYTIFGPELNPSGDSSDLKIEGGDGAWNTQIRLYGKNHLSTAGLINFGVPNAAKSALLTVLQIDGVSDNPIINWYYPIKVDAINEKTVNAGVTIDTCLIKDGKAADTLKIKGKTVDDAAIGDDKILVYKTTGDKLVYETKPTGGGQEIVAATLIVAANDSKDKNRADYECGGANDHIQIQQALDALTGVGGRVVLLEGNYSGTVDLDIESKQALVGQGPSTRLSGMDIEIEANASEILIADMYINGNIDFKTHEIKDSIFRHLSGLDFACENMASTSEGNLFDGVRAKQFKINGKHNRFSDCYAHIPSGTGICFNLLSTATKNWLSNCHAYNGYDEDYMISGKENLLTDCTSKDNRYISIWLASGADRNIISGGMIDGGNVTAAAYNSLIRIQSDDNKIEGMYIIVRDTDTDYGIKIESTADKTMITDIRFKNEGVGTPSEFSDAGSDTRKRDNVGFNGAWVTDT